MLQHSEDEENQNTQDQSALPSTPLLEQKEKKEKEEIKPWTHWFKVPAFYLYGMVYMGVRMLVNVQSVRTKRIIHFNHYISRSLFSIFNMSSRSEMDLKLVMVSQKNALLSQ